MAKEGRQGFAKKRIRNIERLLERNKDLPANVQNDLQRELATLKATVSDKSFHRKRSAMISKYHMVRFFGISSEIMLFICSTLLLTRRHCRAKKGLTISKANQAHD